ncbi:MAG: nicotinate-nucleotide adenylyltransferase [Muribaculaceae bacterium]|jgi:nicotinate-nucleotide adenylyltransferase|nr:nicotinate-nucleotide adenylyltransferase [Muribaculaceae bacterium]
MKIGIFGGSFNPIHSGHAIIAHHIISSGAVDRLWLMVSPVNPLKVGLEQQVADTDRLRMVEMVTRPLENVETSAFEFTMPKPSYTIDTLNALQAKFPDDEFYLVTGADNWVIFERWRNSEEILAKYHLLVYPRLGYDVVIPEELRDRVTLVDAPIIELSSTAVRERLAQGLSARYYVPDEVLSYIERKGLYRISD